ncbi:MAG: glycosyltransferase family 4 protein [Clostridia bacterium]|nr:glycosyltransferase family 4 protein [Clostridia bacterium]
MSKILIAVNHSMTIFNFRLELVQRLLDDGHNVVISSPYDERIEELKAMGCDYAPVTLSRHGMNPIKELKLLNAYKKQLKEIKPNAVFTYTIKPNVYGAMACKKYNIPCAMNITGLGTAIENPGLAQKIALFLYKQGIKGAKTVFFQNKENMQFFKDRKIVGENCSLLPGSGVNLSKFTPIEYPENEQINLVFVGRIMRDKGVYELAQVARKLPQIHFTIVGDTYEGAENPFLNIENIECVGHQKNVIPFLEKANAVVLPSYHEGMANVLLEAAACARPVIASNVHGCYETFDEGITGFGFEMKNTEALKQAILKFAELSVEQMREMGIKAREKMENEFDRNIVVEKYCDFLKNL